MNTVKTVLLLGLLSGLFLFVGESFGGRQGLILGLGMAVAMNFFSYFFSDRIALASYAAQPVTPEENPDVYRRLAPIVQSLCQRMGLPMPRLWLLPEDSPNAFATGRNPAHASVAVTYGLLRILNDRELEGVLAHELGHVYHRDILTSSIAATLASALMVVARIGFFFGGGGDREGNRGGAGGLLMLIVAPIAALLIQMAISRSREFDADAFAARQSSTGPNGLMGALEKLETASQRIPMTDATPATAHMFIVNPFSGQSLMNLFRSHPPTEERLRALAALR
jgi:heat shock protein HtpX